MESSLELEDSVITSDKGNERNVDYITKMRNVVVDCNLNLQHFILSIKLPYYVLNSSLKK